MYILKSHVTHENCHVTKSTYGWSIYLSVMDWKRIPSNRLEIKLSLLIVVVVVIVEEDSTKSVGDKLFSP
jgi:hypothetical protein